MTQEEKARAYDKALEKARARYDKEPTDGYVGYANQILKELFPTLAESEKQEQPCYTCTNDKGCVTCKDGELWEGKEQEPEVDVEEEIDHYCNLHFSEAYDGILLSDRNGGELTYIDIADMARHFYELGKNAK